MDAKYLNQTDNWVLPSYRQELLSTVPNYEDYGPLRVNHDGLQNYLKHRGSLNIGDWATECRRIPPPLTSTEPVIQQRNFNYAPPPKVHGTEAMKNYLKSRSSTPNLIYGNLDPPNPHHHCRVKREGQANYDKAHHSQMKDLLGKYGKLSVPPPPPPHIQGELATDNYYANKKGHVGTILTNYGHFPPSPRPMPHVNGSAAETNYQKAQGSSIMLQHKADFRPTTPDPHVKGDQAHINYEAGRQGHLDKLFHEYGKLPLSARPPPKVTAAGAENYIQARGDAVRKIITQCPPSHRYIERPQSVPVWP